MSSFIVVGAGLVGAASALRLAEGGFAVTLVDPGDARRGASYGNAGHIAVEQCEPLASPRTLASFPGRLTAFGGPLDFRWRDAALWAPWALRFVRACAPEACTAGTRALGALAGEAMGAWERLLALIGAPTLVRANGHAVLWMNARRAARGVETWRRADIGAASLRELAEGELDAYGAVLKRRPAAGVRFSGSGQVDDPQGLREALLAAFAARGGAIVRGEVLRLSAEPNGVKAELASGETLDAERALIAAGAWSRALMRGLGVNAPLIGERGYSVQSAEHSWPADFPPTVFEERSLVVTRFAGALRATSYVEFGAPDAAPDARKWRRIERHLNDLGVAFSPAPDRWAGPRPTLPDYLPAIGRLEGRANVLYAFGHQHLGVTLAAATAELVQALAAGVVPRIDLAPFRIERFS